MEDLAHYSIPAKIKIGSVYYFQEERFSSGEPHYFTVLNKNPRTDELLMLVCASSKVDKRRRIAKSLGFSEKTLVVVLPSEYSIFKEETVIDCNNIFEKTIQSLVDKQEKGELKICEKLMPKEIIQKLINGALMSNQTSEEIRKIILEI